MSTAMADHVHAVASTDRPSLSTEFNFTLARGYVDQRGQLHRDGVMRLATAGDEIWPQTDPRVRENPTYLSVLLLTRTVTTLDTLPEVDSRVIENLFASDLAFLQDLYARVNQEGHSHASVTCPACDHSFEVDLSGDRLGG